MIEELIVQYIPWIIGISAAIIGFWQFRKWNVEKFKEIQKTKKEQAKHAPEIYDKDIQEYIRNPEMTINLLKQQRAIKEKEKDQKGISVIDSQIKMLEILAQIPAPVRPYAGKIGQTLMKKVAGMVDNL